MAKIVDEQNSNDKNYSPMSPNFDKSIAFKLHTILFLREAFNPLDIQNHY